MSPEERIRRLREGIEPRAVVRLGSGWVEMGEDQGLRGYCRLIADPVVGRLNDLTGEARARFLDDMARIGDAVIAETGAVRANYAIYGNLDPFLHAHVWPRFADEDEDVRTRPPLAFPRSRQGVVAWSEAEHGALRDRLRGRL